MKFTFMKKITRQSGFRAKSEATKRNKTLREDDS